MRPTPESTCSIPELLDRIPKDEAYTIPALVEDCLAKGQSVGAFRIEDEWLDIGRPQELGRALGREQQP